MPFDAVDTLLAEIQASWPEFLEFVPRDVQTRLEWFWGLEFGQLREHMNAFPDTEDLFGDEGVVVIPRSNDIEPLFNRLAERAGHRSEPMPPIMEAYDGRDTFKYFCLSVDPTALYWRRVKSTTPPHVVAAFTEARISKATRHELGCGKQTREKLIFRTRALTRPTPFNSNLRTLTLMELLQRSCLRAQIIPANFTSDRTLSDQVVEPESPTVPLPPPAELC
uniref:Uncharacterized protein n=1 Tax=Mycena chlorophos TaxID=658473 RepID=A0ABQ0LPC5_MYCCL|nr:predicted protein [Mycena chlorophos]